MDPVGLLALLSAAAVVAGREAWLIRRRVLANRALHEARRPLQAIALSLPAGPGRLTPVLPVWQAIRALGEVDRQINGGAPDRLRREPIACRLMVEACVRRWQSRARMGGAGIELRWTGPDAVVVGDPATLSAAVENLILNSIEHGGPRIVVRGVVVGRRLRLEVTDNGGRAPDRVQGVRSDMRRRLSGRERRGHGLPVVHEVASRHGGRFDLELEDEGARATLVLPCSSRPMSAAPGIVGHDLEGEPV